MWDFFVRKCDYYNNKVIVLIRWFKVGFYLFVFVFLVRLEDYWYSCKKKFIVYYIFFIDVFIKLIVIFRLVIFFVN